MYKEVFVLVFKDGNFVRFSEEGYPERVVDVLTATPFCTIKEASDRAIIFPKEIVGIKVMCITIKTRELTEKDTQPVVDDLLKQLKRLDAYLEGSKWPQPGL